MDYVKSYRNLEVYKVARDVSKEIYLVSKNFPSEEKYSLTDQIRRSSRSIGAQIAEAWGKRRLKCILSPRLLMLMLNSWRPNTGLRSLVKNVIISLPISKRSFSGNVNQSEKCFSQ